MECTDTRGLGHEDLHGLADQLGALVTEQRFRLGVHQRDAPVLSDADDRIGRGLEQPPKGRLVALAAGDVAHGGGNEHTARRVDSGEGDLCRELRAVGAAARELETGAHRSVPRIPEITGAVIGMGCSCRLRNEHLDLRPDEIIHARSRTAAPLAQLAKTITPFASATTMASGAASRIAL